MEIWKDIEGFKGYKVSNKGNVKSFKRSNGKLLKVSDDGNGYLILKLYKDNKGHTRKVHKLVAIAFLGHVPSGMDLIVHHINNIKTDNRVDNLQIVTARENSHTHHKGTSKHKGVWFNDVSGKYQSYITINSKKKHVWPSP